MYYCPRCTCEQMKNGKIIKVLTTYQMEPEDRICYYCDKEVRKVTNEEIIKTQTNEMVSSFHKEVE